MFQQSKLAQIAHITDVSVLHKTPRFHVPLYKCFTTQANKILQMAVQPTSKTNKVMLSYKCETPCTRERSTIGKKKI